MIFATVGHHSAPFDRLVCAVDDYADTFAEEVVIQRGTSRFKPRAARSFEFCDSTTFEQLVIASRVVVCHAADTILDVLRLGRPVVAMPRRRAFHEHLNDHQVDFARALARRGWIVTIEGPDELPTAIDTAIALSPAKVPPVPPLVDAIRDQLRAWLP